MTQAKDELGDTGLLRTLLDDSDLLRALIDNLPDSIYVKNTEGRYIVSNTGHAKSLGVTKPDEVTGKLTSTSTRKSWRSGTVLTSKRSSMLVVPWSIRKNLAWMRKATGDCTGPQKRLCETVAGRS